MIAVEDIIFGLLMLVLVGVLAGGFVLSVMKPPREFADVRRIEGVGEWICVTTTEEWGKNPVTECLEKQ